MSVLVRSKELKMVPLSEIKLNPKNRNTHPKEQIAELVHIIQTTGFRRPVTISNQSGFLSCGEGRFLAAKKLKMKEIPAIFQDYDSPEQEYADGIADNAIDKWAALDLSSINNDILDMGPDFDIRLMGIKDFVIEPAEKFEAQCDEDSIPDKVEPKTKPGDLYILGSHRLLCGDSTDVLQLAKLLEGKTAELVFTDPPYRMEAEGGSGQFVGKAARKLGEAIKHLCDFDPQAFLNALPTVFPKNVMNAFIFCNKDLVPDYLQWAVEAGYSFNILFWKKPNALPLGGSHRPDVEYLLFFRRSATWNNGVEGVSYSKCLEHKRENSTAHPTMKPVEMICNQLLISSNPGSIVLDLFGGSGSTLIACEKTNRKAHLMELDPKYCDIIVERWEKYTGQTAKLIPSGGEDGENET